MMAITIWQPWATLISLEVKPWEFRGWPAPRNLCGRDIAIHAGRRPVRRNEIQDLIDRLSGSRPWTTGLLPSALPILESILRGNVELPLGHVLCVAELGTPLSGQTVAEELGAAVNDSDRHEHANWAWPLSRIRRLVPPEPAAGKQGFWRWSASSPMESDIS
ncbi:hypothetical protein [Amorphus sp. 3PC139-8]|uniref:hypothetical protein n=1 Tax=Amorphus sp. 3PC139-8 TaxID=2735676 RepID=UPI00345DD976